VKKKLKEKLNFEELEEKELELEKEENIFKTIIKWMFKNVKFLLIPGSKIYDLTLREIEYEKSISKRKFIRRLRSPLTITGILIIFMVVTFAVFPSWIALYTFEEANGVFFGKFAPPSPNYPLGQTDFGRDVYSRMIYGARSSLTIALPAISLSVLAGIVLGVISAYYGGWVDSIIMRIVDIMLAFPALIFALVLVGILGVSLENIILAYGILGIPYYSRLIRGNVLQARQLPYVEAARVSGAGNWAVMFKHILPNVIQPIIISFTMDLGGVILSFAGLAFLGYSDPSLIEWGRDISIARGRLINAPWASFWPGFMIMLTVLGFMLLGDGLRDALDPRLRNL